MGLHVRRRIERLFDGSERLSGILMYHRVSTEIHDPWQLCVTPENFAEQLQVLKSLASCLELSELRRQRRRRGRLRIAITFDDGYRDNITHALKTLERFELPATIFVVSGQLGSRREFWWDALERCVLHPQSLPPALSLKLGRRVRRWTLPDTERSAGHDRAPWCADTDEPVTPRQRLFLELWRLLVALEPEEREAKIDELLSWAGADAAPSGRLAMCTNDVVGLARHPLIRIGCHTVGHQSLPRLSPLAQWREIKGCKRALESLVGRPINVFSYPFGHHDGMSSAIVRRLGFELACTSRHSSVTPVSERWKLPRLQVINESGEDFARRLRSLFPALAAGGMHD